MNFNFDNNRIQSDTSRKSAVVSRDTVLIGIFGAIWGLMEITIGFTLKGLRIPMGGAILTAISCIIFLTGRFFISRHGSIFLMGAVAATIKVFSVGTVIAGPFMAILIEAGIAEILISIFKINRFSYILTSVTLSLYTIIHPFISQGIIFGDDIYQIYLETFKKIALIINLDPTYLIWILLFYVTIHFCLGFFVGWFSYSLSVRVSREIQVKLRHQSN
ncbi:MAG: hypothetical protein JSW33_06465 [bacterium]|nr:MAG: hypothetical protein JSW33_06465 [bacterium]